MSDHVAEVFADAPSDENLFDSHSTLDRGKVPFWYEKRENLALLVEFLAIQGDTAAELAQAVREPWTHGDDFLMAENWDRDRKRK